MIRDLNISEMERVSGGMGTFPEAKDNVFGDPFQSQQAGLGDILGGIADFFSAVTDFVGLTDRVNKDSVLAYDLGTFGQGTQQGSKIVFERKNKNGSKTVLTDYDSDGAIDVAHIYYPNGNTSVDYGADGIINGGWGPSDN